MSQTVQQLVAAFENIPTETKCEFVTPTSSLCVKALVKLFEPTTIDKEESEQIKTGKDSKAADFVVAGTNRKINRNEWSPERCDGDIQQTLVQKLIAMFEKMAYERLLPAHRSLETAHSTLEEEREDGTASVTPTTSDYSAESEVEVQANIDQAASRDNSSIFHVNVPSYTPGHSDSSIMGQAKKLWNKLSWPRVLVNLARRLSISKRNSSKTEGIPIVTDQVQIATRTLEPTSGGIIVEKMDNLLLETAPSTLEEEREDGTTSVNPTTSDCTDANEIKIEANIDKTSHRENPSTFEVNVPSSTPSLSIRSKICLVKNLLSKLSRPRVSMKIDRGLRVFKTNITQVQDIPILTAPVHIASTRVIPTSAELTGEKNDNMLETATYKFEEECEDGTTSVNPTTPDCTAESDIEANLDQTAETESPSTVDRNVPSSTPDHSIRSENGQPRNVWRKLCRPRVLMNIVKGSRISKRNSTKSQDLRILTAPVQIASRTIIPLSTGFSAEENDNVSSETAPSKLKEECQNGTTSVNPSTSDSTTTESGEIEIEANLSHTAQSENLSTIHHTVPSSTSGDHTTRSKMGQAKSPRSKLSTPRFVMNIAKGLGISKRNSRKTKDIRLSIIPTQVSIPIPSSGAGEFKNIEITISVTSVSFK